jgi:putative inorganic carbon (HCO3(-)) transporter
VAAIALVLAAIGGWQYATRDIVWSPHEVVAAARAPAGWFYRVDPAFDDASIYGRFLVVAIVAGLVVVLLRRGRIALVAGAVAGVTWLGLLPSFSQASFVAFAAASAVVLVAAWWRRAALAGAVVVCFVLGAAITVETARNPDAATAVGARSQLVSNAVDLAVDHPVGGVGAGGFAHAYAQRLESARQPGERAARNAPVTVAAELGVVGFALFAWLAAAALVVGFGGDRAAARLAPAAALVAILVHSLLYDALFQDAMFWGLLGLVAATARASSAPAGRPRAAR